VNLGHFFHAKSFVYVKVIFFRSKFIEILQRENLILKKKVVIETVSKAKLNEIMHKSHVRM
jgi:hypothetical protein